MIVLEVMSELCQITEGRQALPAACNCWISNFFHDLGINFYVTPKKLNVVGIQSLLN